MPYNKNISKIEEYIEEYVKVTHLQKAAINEVKFYLLEELLKERAKVICKLEKHIKKTDIKSELSKDTQKLLLETRKIDNENIIKLRKEQKKIRNLIDDIKKNKKGLDSYRKNI